MQQNSLFSALLFICIAFSSAQINCSAQPPRKSYQSLIYRALGIGAVAAIAAVVIATNPLSAAKENLPTNPMQHLNTVQTIDHQCIGFSIHAPAIQGTFVSDVFSPGSHKDLYADLFEGRLGNKKEEIVFHPYDCRYYNHKPYKRQKK